jgi:hypothetical protein
MAFLPLQLFCLVPASALCADLHERGAERADRTDCSDPCRSVTEIDGQSKPPSFLFGEAIARRPSHIPDHVQMARSSSRRGRPRRRS